MPKKSKITSKKNDKKKDQEANAPEVKKDKGEKEKPSAPSGGKKRCILIVEDERPLAHALELKFAHEGFEPHIALDGEQAIDLMKKHKSVAILLDLIMPNMDGFTFLEELKKKKSKIPVVILTNLGQSEDEQRAMDLGAKGYFVKSNTPIFDIVKHVKTIL